jgi:4-hydroxyphenylpyruvate dioxygenase
MEAAAVHTDVRGALTKPCLGGVSFELVQHAPAP